MNAMVPYSPTTDTPTHYQPALMGPGGRCRTRAYWEAYGFVFVPRPDLDGFIYRQAGPAFDMTFDGESPGIYCEKGAA